MFAITSSATETQLANRGIRLGSTAYDKAIGNLGQQENDAYNQLLLGGRQQANQELLTERNQPINEISALLSQSQVSNPQFQPATQRNVPTVDYAGLVQDNYRTQSENFRASQASRTSLLGGLFGLGGNLLKLIPSDRRLKTDIKKLGKTENGLNLYSYRMIWGGPTQIGLMADEVKQVNPDAVVAHPAGFDMVDYELALGA